MKRVENPDKIFVRTVYWRPDSNLYLGDFTEQSFGVLQENSLCCAMKPSIGLFFATKFEGELYISDIRFGANSIDERKLRNLIESMGAFKALEFMEL
jgi:hypothetical protein